MADHTILISVVDATGCVLRIYETASANSMKQFIQHFKNYACPACANPENITFWYEDTQITPLHTPASLELPSFAKITIKPSMLCNTSTTELGHFLPILHYFSDPLVRLHGGDRVTCSTLGGTVFPFGTIGLHGQRDREIGWGRRQELRMRILDLKKEEKDLVRKIVVGSVYEKYAANGEGVGESVKRLMEDRNRVGERCRMLEAEFEREGRRDSVWVP